MQGSFAEAVKLVEDNVKSFSQSQLLELYGLYKLATVGLASDDSKPALWDIKGRMKW